jgi:type IV secretory pathway VirJ component
MKRPIIFLGCVVAAALIFFTYLGYFSANPFAYTPATTTRSIAPGVAAILWSGDMGIRLGMGREVAESFVDAGIPVLGVNSLSYFRARRSPHEATALLEESLHRLRQTAHPRSIILVGQSYGADMLQVALAGLREEQRRDVRFIALVVPGAAIEFRASPGELFTFAMKEDDGLPTARLLGWVPTLCLSGAEERRPLCPLLHQRGVQSVSLPGGHPLRHDHERVFARIEQAMRNALALRQHYQNFSD